MNGSTAVRPLVHALVMVLALLAAGLVRPPGVSAQGMEETYTVREGDTLYRVARMHRVTVQSLRELNGLQGDVVQAGQVLVVRPRSPATEAAMPLSGAAQAEDRVERFDSEVAPINESADDSVEPFSDAGTTGGDAATGGFAVAAEAGQARAETDATTETGYYMIRAGETLFDVALGLGLPVDQLVEMNPDLPTYLSSGDSVRVPISHALSRHVVRSGETLYRISRQYGTSVDAVKARNGLRSDDIRVGQVLMVPGRYASFESARAGDLPILGRGGVSPYPRSFAGRLMAGGRRYDPDGFTVSHSDLPLGSVVLITSLKTGKSTFAEVADRTPASRGYMMDISEAISEHLFRAGDKPSDVVVRVAFRASGRGGP